MEQNKFLFSTTRIPGAVQDTVRAPYSAEWPGPVHAPATSWCSTAATCSGWTCSAPTARRTHSTICAAGLRRGPEGRRGARPRRTPRVGHLTTKARAEWAASRAGAAGRRTRQRRRPRRGRDARCSACAWRTSPRRTPRRPATSCCTATAATGGSTRRVSLIVFADGTRRHQRRALRAGRHHDPQLRRHAAGHAGRGAVPAVGRRGRRARPPVEPIEFVLDDELRADIGAAAASFADYGAATATLTLSFADFGAERAKAAGDVAGRLRADGLPARPPAGQGTRRRHLRVDRHPPVPARPHRGDARGHAGGAEVRGHDGRPRAPTRRPGGRRSGPPRTQHVQRAKECQAGEAPEQHLWELQLIQQRRGERARRDRAAWRCTTRRAGS